MNKRIKRYAFLTLLAAGLGSCTSEDFWDTFDRTVDGPIDFTVGIESSPAQRAMTRGEGDPYPMTNGSKVLLKVDGTWVKKTETVSKTATCTTSGSSLVYDEGQTLYWDDYGAGDPNNKENNDKGLSILGVAVDGMTTAPAVGDGEWESLSWTVITNGENVLNSDIIVSNNLKTYTFDNRNSDSAKKMEFIHPLSKITFNIKAGQGFPNTGVGATTTKFAKDPILTLSNAKTLAGISETTNNYALTTGIINIKDGIATSNGEKSTVIAGTTSVSDDNITVIKQAIVYPDTQLGENDDDVIAVLQADDNVYYIKAKDIHDKMTGHTEYKTKAGYNYIINITVNKTGIRTTATVTDWNKVNSDEVHPVINVSAGIGDHNGNATPSDFSSFDFWRSDKKDKDYQKEAIVSGDITKDEDWSFNQILYWHHHNDHYHFRGIFPTDTPVTKDTDDTQYVAVQNGAYSATTFPSNFLMGMPEFSGDNYMCKNDDHTSVDMRENGICARTSAINLNFRYMMSQVEVNLTSSDSNAKDYVDLTYCDVKLVNVGTKGKIMLSDRSAKINEEANEYLLPVKSSSDNLHYHGIIVPQTLVNTDTTNKVRFKITVYKDLEKTIVEDVYYADVAPIVKSGTTDLLAPNKKWKSGVHYVYNLKITKTEIKATATLTDWTTVEAAEDVWL